jgi:UDP-N-acetylmuramoyl-tripeptide--D-alanyl-D-alanine ligase
LKYNVYATPGNFNNHVGVPMTLLALREEHDVAVVELGTNHPGEMKELCQLFLPHYGVITNIGKEHLEGFGTEEAVAREESELYLRLQECGGKAFVNADDAWLSNMSKRLESKFSYGIQSETADLHGRVLSAMPHLNFELGLPVVGSTTRAWHGTFQAQLGGSYNLYNVLAAIAIGMELGISLDHAAAACCSYVPSNNRSQWVQTPKTQVYLDAYNANPSSMLAALSDFVRLEGPEINRKAVLLGDMFELGENEVAEHKAILDWLFQQPGLDVYLCGPRFTAAAGSFPMVFDSADALLAWLDTHPIDAEYAFIKGSRGMKMEKALEHFQGLS